MLSEYGAGGVPTIFWVVGSGTDVGKTTVAAALIRELNAQGQKAVGFKPYSAMRLQNAVDTMIERYPTSSCKLFGNDAWSLVQASPLTDMDMADLVVPAQVLCYPSWRWTVLLRTGSGVLGNVQYFTNARGVELRRRADIRELIEKTGLPFEAAQVCDRLDIQDVSRLAGEKPALAFRRLVELGADAVVVEGAGEWLPIWRGNPAANHLVVVAGGEITFVPHVDLFIPHDPLTGLVTINALNDMLRGRKPAKFSSPLYLVEEQRRSDILQEMLRGLIDKARRLRRAAAL